MPATTTHDLPTIDHRGRQITHSTAETRVQLALADRLLGATWAEIAETRGYRSARVAETNVMRLVRWYNQRTGRMPVADVAAPALVTTLHRCFGVEIEFAGITISRAARVISEVVGYTVNGTRYHGGNGYDAWHVESDGSVTTSHGGGEAVSPILSGPEGLDELRRVMAALRAAGARVDRRCGMHVHVDMRDLTGEQIARTYAAYVDRQAAMDSFVAPSRRAGRNAYCRAVGEYEKAQTVESFKATRTAPRVDRYRTVNVQPFSRYGTLEFRQHQGTLNGAKAVAWVSTLLAMVNSVLNGADEELPVGPVDLIVALRAHGLPQSAAYNMRRRAMAAGLPADVNA